MAHIDLHLITAIIHDSAMGEALREGLLPEHFTNAEARMVYDYLYDYYHHKNTRHIVPSWTIVKKNFPTVDFPLPDKDNKVSAYVLEVKREYQRNRVIEIFDQVSDIYEADPYKAVQIIHQASRELITKADLNTDITIAEGMQSLLTRYETLDKSMGVTGIPFPFRWGHVDVNGNPVIDPETGRQDHPLNEGTMGVQESDLVYIYGRQGSMKTWVLCDMVANCLIEENLRCLCVTKELPQLQLLQRIVCIMGGFDYDRLRRWTLSDVEKRYYKELMEELSAPVKPGESKAGLLVSELIDPTGNMARELLLQKLEDYQPDILFVDGAYVMRLNGRTAGNDFKDVRDLALFFKEDVAKSLRVPTVITGQANRRGEEKAGEDTTEVSGGDGWAEQADLMFRVIKTENDTPNNIYDLTFRLAKGRECSFPGFRLTVQMGNSIQLSQVFRSQSEIRAALVAERQMQMLDNEKAMHEAMSRRSKALRIGMPDNALVGTRGNVIALPCKR